MDRTAMCHAPRRRAAIGALGLAMVVGILAPAGAAAQTDPRQGLAPGSDASGGSSAAFNAFTVPNADAETAEVNMELLANRPKPRWTNAAGQDLQAAAFSYANINSDLAFTGDVAVSGNYRGFGLYDVSDPNDPQLRTTVNCVGGQGDVSVVGDLLFVSVESAAARVDCGPQGNSLGAQASRLRGVRIFDISDLDAPQQVAVIQTCRGSHTHTVVPDPNDDRVVYVYNSGTSSQRNAAESVHTPQGFVNNRCGQTSATSANPSQWMIEVIKVPLDDPGAASVVTEARLFADPETGAVNGLQNTPAGTPHPCSSDPDPAFFCAPAGGNYSPTPNTNTCHDITSYAEFGIAVGACQGNGILIDITDPANPVRLDAVADPNFSYWHSATLSNDGDKVIFTDEWGGGGGARCLPQHRDEWGSNAIFDIVQTDAGPKLEFASYYKIPGVQATNEVCVAHNGSLVPVPGRDVMVQAWYEGGVSVFDFTDSANPTEIAFFDRGPYHPTVFHQGGYWSAYWHNGNIYGNEIFLGFDAFGLQASEFLTQNELDAARTVRTDETNAQSQVRTEWAPSFALARAYTDQAERAGLAANHVNNVRRFVDRAERFQSGPQARAAVANLKAVANQVRRDAPDLAGALDDLAGSLG
jgi:hypothetical protein